MTGRTRRKKDERTTTKKQDEKKRSVCVRNFVAFSCCSEVPTDYSNISKYYTVLEGKLVRGLGQMEKARPLIMSL